MTYTAEQAAKVGAEFCVTCKKWCLPLPPLDTCGFCDRLPATGDRPVTQTPAQERAVRRQRWRENQAAARAAKRTSTVQNKESADRHAVWMGGECPDCHDVAHPSATVCEGCGAHLYPPTRRSAA